jgi:hypothetical protein
MREPDERDRELRRANLLVASLRDQVARLQHAAHAASAALLPHRKSSGQALPCPADCGCSTSASGEIQCKLR